MNLDLGKIRDEIDAVDENIVNEFQKRMKLCKDVATYKIEMARKFLTSREKKRK